MGKTEWRDDGAGGLVEVDCDTGEILTVQRKKTHYADGKPVKAGGRGRGRPRKHDGPDHLVAMPDGSYVQVPKGTNPDSIPREVWPVSTVMDDQILAKVSEGMSVAKIGELIGYPPASTIYRWLRTRKDFRAQFNLAKGIRAEALYDKAMNVAEEVDEDNAQASRVKADIYKWGAKVNDPSTFGDKVKVSGDPEAPMGFIIVTGVPRKAEIPVESTTEDRETSEGGQE